MLLPHCVCYGNTRGHIVILTKSWLIERQQADSAARAITIQAAAEPPNSKPKLNSAEIS
jgi:hypothetical protein